MKKKLLKSTHLATDDGIESESIRYTSITSTAHDSRRADTLASNRMAEGERRTVTHFAVGKAEEACSALGTSPADYIGFALTLTAEFCTFITERSICVTLTW